MQRVGDVQNIRKREQRSIMLDERVETRSFAHLVDRGGDPRGERRAGADVSRHADVITRGRDAAHDRSSFGFAHNAYAGQTF